ncbi:MAG: hypothetical protein OEU26_05180, partial [Candidatus Tectomicrobia bacterium]|nr:hypothetical protein [Candidatus Tectomicrobia bacterium]
MTFGLLGVPCEERKQNKDQDAGEGKRHQQKFAIDGSWCRNRKFHNIDYSLLSSPQPVGDTFLVNMAATKMR